MDRRPRLRVPTPSNSGLICKAPDCNSSGSVANSCSRNVKNRFHKFPTDQRSKKEWCGTLRINTSDVNNGSSSYLCSMHYNSVKTFTSANKNTSKRTTVKPTQADIAPTSMRQLIPNTQVSPSCLPSNKSAYAISVALNPRVLLFRLPDSDNDNCNHSQPAVSSTSTSAPLNNLTYSALGSPCPSSSTKLQQYQSQNAVEQPVKQLLNTEKVILVLNSNKGKQHCLLCSSSQEDRNLAVITEKQQNSDLLQVFCEIFNIPRSTFEKELFCINCIEELELLNYCNQQVQIMTRQLEDARGKIMRIMVRNYVQKKTEKIERRFVVDQLTEDWKLNLEYEKLNQQTKHAHSKLIQSFQRHVNIVNETQYLNTTEIFQEESAEAETINSIISDCDSQDQCSSLTLEMEQDDVGDYFLANDSTTTYTNNDDLISEMKIDEIKGVALLPCDSKRIEPQISAEDIKNEFVEVFQIEKADHVVEEEVAQRLRPRLRPIRKREYFDSEAELPKLSPSASPSATKSCSNDADIGDNDDEDYSTSLKSSPRKTKRKPASGRLLVGMNADGYYACRFCPKFYPQIRHRNKHEKYSHLLGNTKIYHCQFCTQAIPCNGKFLRHLQEIHLPQKEIVYGDLFCYYFCDEVNCEECFISHELLETHIQKVHRTKFNCSTTENCGQIFANKVNYEAHVKNVHNDNNDEEGSGVKVNSGCEYCHMDFIRPGDLEIHKEIHLVKIEAFEFKCTNCDKSFRTKNGLRNHKRVKHKLKLSFKRARARAPETAINNGTKCRFCKQTFINVRSYNMRIHELKCNRVQYLAEKPCLCKICFMCFGSEVELQSHQKEIHDQSKCKVCGVQLLDTVGLKIHLLSHSARGKTRKPPKICEPCGMSFSNKDTLAIHKSVFHAEQEVTPPNTNVRLKCSYGCEVETFAYSYAQRKHHVNTHADIHLAGNAVYCKICYEVFNTDEELAEHKSTALGHRILRCKVCGKEFTRSDALKHHKYEHMPDHPGFPCEICAKVFKNPQSLATHKMQHVRKPKPGYQKGNCQYCGKVINKGVRMNRHLFAYHKEEFLKTVTHFCEVCCSGFDTEEEVQKHVDAKHHKCQFCGRGFLSKYKLDSHENTHTGNQPFQCQICGKRFAHDPNLIAHLRTHKKKEQVKNTQCKSGMENLPR